MLWEQVNGATPGGFVNSGLTDHYVRVSASPDVLTNTITTVRVARYSDGKLVAELLRRVRRRQGKRRDELHLL